MSSVQQSLFFVHAEPWVSASPSVAFVTNTCLGLAAAGAMVHMIVPANQRTSPEQTLREHFGVDLPSNMVIHCLEHAGRRDFRRQAAALIHGLHTANSVIITRSLMLLPKLATCANKLGLPIYFESHNCYYAPWQRDDSPLRKTWKSMLRERLHLARCTGIICLSEAQAGIYRNHLGTDLDIVVCEPGCTQRSFANRSWPTQAPTFAYLGSLDSRKGLDNVVQLAAQWQPSRFLIIGGKNEHETQPLRQAFDQIGASDRLEVTGWVDAQTMHAHLRRAHFGLSPLQDTYFNRYLTSPSKIHDYLSTGLPVIASDLPTTREILGNGDAGLLVDWSQTKTIVNQLTTLEVSAYSVMSQRSHDISRMRTWEIRGQNITQAIFRDRATP